LERSFHLERKKLGDERKKLFLDRNDFGHEREKLFLDRNDFGHEREKLFLDRNDFGHEQGSFRPIRSRSVHDGNDLEHVSPIDDLAV
jgi:hypothetical protein